MDTIAFRPDKESAEALDLLTRDSLNTSAAIRRALVSAARHQKRQELLAESTRLAADESDREEARQVLADMEHLRAW